MSQRYDTDLMIQAVEIKNETQPAANTATRLGKEFVDLTDSKVNHQTNKSVSVYTTNFQAMLIDLRTLTDGNGYQQGFMTLANMADNSGALLQSGFLQLNYSDPTVRFASINGQKNTDIRPSFSTQGTSLVVVRLPAVSGKIGAQVTVPGSANDAGGEVGSMAFDDNFGYVKTASGWKKFALTAVS